jgi:hypothetical protein
MSVMPAIRTSLRRALSPRAYGLVRFRWWYLSFYFPRLVISWFVNRTPEVRAFIGNNGASDLLRQLRSVNTLAPTNMCRVMTKYGSDKGHGWHNYTTVYSVLFEGWRDRPLRVFELGLGTNNPDLASTVWVNGRPGASLRGWRDLFPHALVYGADIDRGSLFKEDRIKTFYCDQLDQVTIRQLWSQPELQGGMDIIVEDGLHTFEANVAFLEGSLEHLRPGGIYVVEDILQKWVDGWSYRLQTIYSKQYPNYEFAFVVLPNPLNPNFDNNLLVIRRGV